MSPGRFIFGNLPWYSVLVVSGMIAAILLSQREEKRLGLPADTTVDLALWLLPMGVIGARLYYVIFNWSAFAGDPLSALYIWQGGLAIYGGILGGGLAVILFARRRKLSLLTLGDMVAPGVALAQAIGRWGNFFNSEAYGPAVSDPRFCFFPLCVLIPNDGWHMATFFYESLWNVLVFALLWHTRKNARRGDTLLRYGLLYACGRLVIEGLREDSLTAGSFRVSQLLACVIALGVCGFVVYRRFLRGQRLHPAQFILCVLPVVISAVVPLPQEIFPLYRVFLALAGILCTLTVSRQPLTWPTVAVWYLFSMLPWYEMGYVTFPPLMTLLTGICLSMPLMAAFAASFRKE